MASKASFLVCSSMSFEDLDRRNGIEDMKLTSLTGNYVKVN